MLKPKTSMSAILMVAALFAPALAHAQQADTESPEERAYEGRTDSQIRSWIHDGNREATDEERDFIKGHWARAAKLWRIRRLAMDAKDNASVQRVDALLLRADRILEEHLRRLREHAPVMTEPPSMVEATAAPPPPQVEVQGAPPSPGEVWQPGFWQWNNGRHVWMKGRWDRPPQTGMTWEAPKWENRAGKWMFHEGRWRAPETATPQVYEPPPPPAQPEVAVQAPPPPIVEVRPPAPPNGVWIPGYWRWNGTRHEWIGGRWSAAKQGMRWEPDHWEHHGNQWQMVHGRWSR